MFDLEQFRCGTLSTPVRQQKGIFCGRTNYYEDSAACIAKATELSAEGDDYSAEAVLDLAKALRLKGDAAVDHVGDDVSTGFGAVPKTKKPKAPTATGMALADAAGNTYRAFRNTELFGAGYTGPSVGDAVRAIANGRQDELGIQAAAVGGISDQGGFLLSSQLSNNFVDRARASSVCVKAGAQSIALNAAETRIVRVASDPTLAWRRETESVVMSNPTLEQVVLRPAMLTALVGVSIELLEDGANVSGMLDTIISGAFASELDRVILRGSGANAEPLGILNSSGVNTVTSIGTPTDNSYISDAIYELLLDNYAGPLSGLALIEHPRTTKTRVQLVGTNEFQPLQLDEWSREIQRYTSTNLSIVEVGGAESSSVLGDFSQILIGHKGGLVVEVLDSGTAVDASSVSWNSVTQFMKLVRARLRVDVAVMRPAHFAVCSGITIT